MINMSICSLIQVVMGGQTNKMDKIRKHDCIKHNMLQLHKITINKTNEHFMIYCLAKPLLCSSQELSCHFITKSHKGSLILWMLP